MEFAIAAVFALRSRRLPLRWSCILRPGRAIVPGSSTSSSAITAPPTSMETSSSVQLTS